MIIPQREQTIIYYCPICRGHYIPPPIPVSCCVVHAPGQCCHYGDRKLTKSEVVAIDRIRTSRKDTSEFVSKNIDIGHI